MIPPPVIALAVTLASMLFGVLAAAYAPRGALRIAVRVALACEFAALVAYVASGATDCGIACTSTQETLPDVALVAGPAILLALTAAVAATAYRRALRRARGQSGAETSGS